VIEYIASAPVAGPSPAVQLDPERVPAPAPQQPSRDVGLLFSHPLLAAMSDTGRQTVAKHGKEVRLPAHIAVVRRWGADRDFYFVLEGNLDVDVEGSIVRRLHAGTIFGELAARDWGSGFGYPRLATVTTSTPVRLWQLPPEVFGPLIAAEPMFKSAVDAAVRERLPIS
jgi:CRP-like cAMP-binding protein